MTVPASDVFREPKRFIPLPTEGGGGSLVGNSYLSKWAQCPRAWFNSFYRPFEGSQGVRPRYVSEHLLKGGTFHEGIAELYLSGCRDGEDTGEWNLDQAIGILESHHKRNESQYEESTLYETDLNLTRSMLTAYYSEFGLGGPSQDYPTIRTLHDGEGLPLVERDFSVDLGYGGYVYTCRADLLILHHGYPKVMEHKTSAPGLWAQKRVASIQFDSQFTGEIFVLKALFPDEILEGALVNVVIKGGKTKIALRESTTRSDEDLRHFRLSTIHILQQIDEAVHKFNQALIEGNDIEWAMSLYFPDHGERTQACDNYGGCEFRSLCRSKNRIDRVLPTFRPRTRAEVVESRENPF